MAGGPGARSRHPGRPGDRPRPTHRGGRRRRQARQRIERAQVERDLRARGSGEPHGQRQHEDETAHMAAHARRPGAAAQIVRSDRAPRRSLLAAPNGASGPAPREHWRRRGNGTALPLPRRQCGERSRKCEVDSLGFPPRRRRTVPSRVALARIALARVALECKSAAPADPVAKAPHFLARSAPSSTRSYGAATPRARQVRVRAPRATLPPGRTAT